ncbi:MULTISPECIES: BMP family ABC transporter substrate-binding protein [unclassified Polaromonas]|jgi:simple sugar transport system substrate-binding protein|uniref:BMP family ABC transporter substrate-binding protein n=1 Tax=unclassified Polaromonas TaxID=2638319 RepID=UPI000BCA1A1D|nr:MULTISPECIES: BMP family ABC transporter substrate-binding protein [unclassified Polaromonas]OYY38058.1 MAG: BMP family ABC transporter substrate-binding protein [Polaromonas sp. 35-63-35]OYZ18501.1 MAG: BMP family ABC transporter substrate-binding protein [Polaromonas sp. 16-63-31]OYZ79606.1 MAG: BMP family ABC transporter substrate-binding protein [Polaromonas sp. 24-63-21]OZA50753.1 MAG: BMP family ABC transporter substrate-binding protein [Polaromonas sp. 17-63-33]OZA89610.1 MAG: BMP fa
MYKNLAAALAAACFISPVFSQPAAPAKEPLKIGFVYVAPLTDAGWVRQHDDARKAVETALGNRVKTTYVENVPEGADAERVIRDLASQGHRLIFTPSFGYMEPTLKVAKDFPDVKFESITGYKTAPNVAVANARYYEGRYLAGIAAGRLASSAGYVAGFAIPEVIQGINAFTLGMRSVNPKAEVKVVWLGAWFDPPREREAAMTLFNQGVEVIAFHTGSTAVMSAAQERGKLAIAYHSDMRKVAPDAQVLAVTHQWGDYYTRRARAVLDGSWKSGAVWGGVKEGMIRVDSFGPKVPKKVVEEVLARQKDIAAGKLHPFRARTPLLDNEGREVLAAGKTLSDEQILGMNFLVQGVQGKLAK